MQSTRVKDLMVPLEAYPTVTVDACLYDAVMALEQAQAGLDPGKAKHRAVLVLNAKGDVVGKIGFLDLVQGLEPRYAEVEELKHIGSSFTADFIRSLLKKYPLWEHSLDDICRKAAQIGVKEVMYQPSPTELISEDASLAEAIHQLVVDRRQSLLVTRKGAVVGVLRLSDVVHAVCESIKACGLVRHGDPS